MPSSATSSPLPEANVIAVGPGAPNKDGVVQPLSVRAGDKVLLPSWGGQQIKVGEEVSVGSQRGDKVGWWIRCRWLLLELWVGWLDGVQ